jgi:hypothetical protein
MHDSGWSACGDTIPNKEENATKVKSIQNIMNIKIATAS